jgi:O-antigen/teichoic acid export membrane protein
LGGTVGAAVVGITMAVKGFGVWALVGQYLFNTIIDTIVLWYTVNWRPKWQFSWKRLKVLLGFGSKILAIAVTTTIYEDIRQLLIGKIYTTSDLAYYNKAKQFPALINSNINTSIDSILLPVMSKVQDNLQEVRAITRRAIKTSTYIMAPLLVGLAMCGDAFIELLLTEKWLPCVPYMRIFCVIDIFTPMVTANHNAYKAVGRLDLYFKGSIISKIFGLAILFLTLPYCVLAIAYGLLGHCFINLLICAYPNKALLGYGFFEQLKDILPVLALVAVMGIVVYLVELLNLNAMMTILIQILSGMIVYVLGSILFKFESFRYVLNILMKKRKSII